MGKTAVDKQLNLAVYIDADNVSWKEAKKIRAVILSIGTIKKAVAIGEESRFKGKQGWQTSNWTSVCPVRTSGKKANATDFEMTMRMGEDVASGKFDGFCIVADDKDYITAVERLKARGKKVYGIGQGKAPEKYRELLARYFDLSKISEDKPVPQKQVAKVKKRKRVKHDKCECEHAEMCTDFVKSDGCIVWVTDSGERIADYDLNAMWD
ncbi:MAG: NYN domain-containing protein [Kiritimatiellae bacterium]|nr:NYN domain-containing protein [Kiritimatiellia bacterium]